MAENVNGAPLSPELAALDPDRETVTDQGAAGPGASPGDGERDAAMGLASMVVGVLAGGIARRWPATAYTDAEKESLSLVLAPLFVKYGLNAVWLEKWRAEFSALGVLVQLGMVGYQRIEAASAPAPAKTPTGTPVD